MLLAAPLPAAAQEALLDLSTPHGVAKALQDAGYKAEIAKTKDGDSYINSAANGAPFTVNFYNCEPADGCGSIQFYGWYKKKPEFTADLANRWNSRKRFVRVEIDDVGDLGMHLDIATVGKLTKANFADLIDWWNVMTENLSEFLDKEEAERAKKTPAAAQ
ncbi:YbjN domain-containing protein [Sphingomonas psychrotolerans]|nr:YbjN domain-containing protein [Sphingomonas psychrotolerans]